MTEWQVLNEYHEGHGTPIDEVETGRVVCWVPDDAPEGAARLIAAAPKLIEAAEAIEARMQNWINCVKWKDWKVADQMAVEELWAAIDAATGRIRAES